MEPGLQDFFWNELLSAVLPRQKPELQLQETSEDVMKKQTYESVDGIYSSKHKMFPACFQYRCKPFRRIVSVLAQCTRKTLR